MKIYSFYGIYDQAQLKKIGGIDYYKIAFLFDVNNQTTEIKINPNSFIRILVPKSILTNYDPTNIKLDFGGKSQNNSVYKLEVRDDKNFAIYVQDKVTSKKSLEFYHPQNLNDLYLKAKLIVMNKILAKNTLSTPPCPPYDNSQVA